MYVYLANIAGQRVVREARANKIAKGGLFFFFLSCTLDHDGCTGTTNVFFPKFSFSFLFHLVTFAPVRFSEMPAALIGEGGRTGDICPSLLYLSFLICWISATCQPCLLFSFLFTASMLTILGHFVCYFSSLQRRCPPSCHVSYVFCLYISPFNLISLRYEATDISKHTHSSHTDPDNSDNPHPMST